jgi:hypothetical protein
MPSKKTSRKAAFAPENKVNAKKVHKTNEQRSTSPLLISYMTLRKTIGVLGTTLPFIVSLGGLIIFQTKLQGSISSYYYTGMRDVFVGTLWAIGIFLFAYKGYDRIDNMTGNLACIFAIGITLFPTTPEGPDIIVTNNARIIGYVHMGFAALFFGTLSYFSLVLFTKTQKNSASPMTARKQQRNAVYVVCGYIMLVCIVLMAIYSFLPSQSVAFLSSAHPIYWLEALAIVAFGVSWLIKGETILKDGNQFWYQL